MRRKENVEVDGISRENIKRRGREKGERREHHGKREKGERVSRERREKKGERKEITE